MTIERSPARTGTGLPIDRMHTASVQIQMESCVSQGYGYAIFMLPSGWTGADISAWARIRGQAPQVGGT